MYTYTYAPTRVSVIIFFLSPTAVPIPLLPPPPVSW